MKKRCKNCVHCTRTIDGDAWCERNITYTNNNGSCTNFKSKYSSIDNIAWVSAVVGLIVALLGIMDII